MRPINADALTSKFEALKNQKGNCLLDVIFLDGAISVVDTAPTLDYEPVRHGEWIMKSDDNSSGVCSWCNRSDHIDPLATHCRYCGAKMDGGKEK